jgi:hypothetical protein
MASPRLKIFDSPLANHFSLVEQSSQMIQLRPLSYTGRHLPVLKRFEETDEKWLPFFIGYASSLEVFLPFTNG